MAVEQAPEQAPASSADASNPDQDVAWIERKLVEEISALPFVLSISYEPDCDGSWTVVIRHDLDNIADAIYAVVGKTMNLYKIPSIPYLETRILRVEDKPIFMPADPKKIFER